MLESDAQLQPDGLGFVQFIVMAVAAAASYLQKRKQAKAEKKAAAKAHAETVALMKKADALKAQMTAPGVQQAGIMPTTLPSAKTALIIGAVVVGGLLLTQGGGRRRRR
jgi:hypothetical protein